MALCRNKGVVKKAEAQQPGQAVEAMYDYIASDDIPFAPDPRKELSMQRGQTFHLLHKRPEDGWCLVATNNKDGVEGWVSLNCQLSWMSMPLLMMLMFIGTETFVTHYLPLLACFPFVSGAWQFHYGQWQRAVS